MIGRGQPNRDAVANLDAQVVSQRLVQQHLGALQGKRRRLRIQFPEGVIHTQHQNLVGAAFILGGCRFDRTLGQQDRPHRVRETRQRRAGGRFAGGRQTRLQLGRQFLAKIVIADQRFVDRAEPIQHQIAQAAPDRGADQQGAGQHGGGRGSGQGHAEIELPMPNQAPHHILAEVQHLSPREVVRRETRSAVAASPLIRGCA